MDMDSGIEKIRAIETEIPNALDKNDFEKIKQLGMERQKIISSMVETELKSNNGITISIHFSSPWFDLILFYLYLSWNFIQFSIVRIYIGKTKALAGSLFSIHKLKGLIPLGDFMFLRLLFAHMVQK